MRSIKKSGITALTAAIALSLGAVPVALTTPALIARGEAPMLESATSANPGYDPIGHLALATRASGGSITRYNATGQPVGDPQSLDPAAQCRLAQSNSLLEIDGYVGTRTDDLASFAGGSIGVAEKKSGQSCSQVGMPAEKLVLTLNAQLQGSLGPALIESAQLDIEAKQSARILATAMTGTTTTGHFELQSGTNVGSDPLVAGATVFQCTSSADSGPDAGAADNCRWPVSKTGVLFTSLILEVKNGSFSLEGGADGEPTASSIFQLVQRVDGTLACPDNPATPITATESVVRPLDALGGKPEVKIRRIANADSLETCESIPYTLANGPSNATFYKPLDRQVTAQFIVTLRWWFPVGTYTQRDNNGTTDGGIYFEPPAAELRATTIDFEIAGDPGPLKMGWCVNPLITNGALVGVANAREVPDMEPNLANVQHACVGTRAANPVGQVGDTGPHYYELREQVYLQGDARWSG